jgi:dTDP-4-dehydrorhamnose reductase
MKCLVLGATGMLGHAMFRVLSADPRLTVLGSVRSDGAKSHFLPEHRKNIYSGVTVENPDSIVGLIAATQPDVVVNCIGLVKQLAASDSPLLAIPLNSMLPHRLAALCQIRSARLIHISTDCVFSGTRGGYVEEDVPDATDLYGRSKLLGEVDCENAITLRTSIIGHELSGGARSLLCWFLAQEGEVKGFTRAVFSGLPTDELARVVHSVVLPRPDLHGLYHVASDPIDKYSLLRLVADAYAKKIVIKPDDQLVIDRSLSAEKFRRDTGYKATNWPRLIDQMREFSGIPTSPGTAGH